MHHIDGIKGLLCFLIMLGHFWHIYSDIPGESVLSSPLLDSIKNSIISRTLLSEQFWLYAFFVISGYLLAQSRITCIRMLVVRSVKRFLRLFIPIFGACLFIYLIQETIGFHTADTGEYFTSSWFQSYYLQDLNWQSIFIEPLKTMFFAGSRFNAPFWVIRDMFISSILIYICIYADHRWEKKACFLPWFFLLLSFFAMDSRVIFPCLAGYLLARSRAFLEKHLRNTVTMISVSLAVPALVFLLAYVKVLPRVFNHFLLITLLYCAMLVIADRLSLLRKCFSSKPFMFMGEISFGVYAFHWPVICSVGSLTLIACLNRQWAPELTLLASVLLCAAVTVLLSMVYHWTVEKATSRILTFIR